MRLIIIGAGGFGREILAWAEACKRAANPGDNFEIGGFLDDNAADMNSFGIDYPVLGKIREYEPQNEDRFVIAIGKPSVRLKLAEELSSRFQFTNIVHPTAILGGRVTLGVGCIICPYVVVTCDTIIGDHVVLNMHTMVGHDVTIGDGSVINGHCEVTGNCKVGRGVLMGAQSALIPGTKVGDGAQVAAGSTAFRRVEAGTTVIGVPARKLFAAK